MITIFNRKLLISTYDMSVQAKVRSALQSEGIDYTINPIMLSARAYSPAEYKIYVKKKDYERAAFAIKDVFR